MLYCPERDAVGETCRNLPYLLYCGSVQTCKEIPECDLSSLEPFSCPDVEHVCEVFSLVFAVNSICRIACWRIKAVTIYTKKGVMWDINRKPANQKRHPRGSLLEMCKPIRAQTKAPPQKDYPRLRHTIVAALHQPITHNEAPRARHRLK